MRWILGLSIRWKLQFGGFALAAITILINRVHGYNELIEMYELALKGGVSEEGAQQLSALVDSFWLNSIIPAGIEFFVLFFIIGFLAKRLIYPILELCEAVEGMDHGDLTIQVPIRSHDEVGVLERSFNSMLEHLNQIMRRIDDSGKQMGQSAYQIATISHETAESGKQEQQRCDEVTHAAQNLEQTSQTVRDLAKNTLEQATQSQQQASNGVESAKRTLSQMSHAVEDVHHVAEEVDGLNDSAEQIYSIINSIRDIASQTNLLALNAAIEAARAGEDGRGFAVVADEVRNLAGRTTDATEEISTIIDQLKQRVDSVSNAVTTVVDEVKSGQEQANESEQLFKTLAAAVSETSQANSEIHTASEEQLLNFSSLQNELQTLFHTLGQNAAKVSSSATISDNLYEVTAKLNTLLGDFNFSRQTDIPSKPNEQRRSPRLENHVRVQIQTDEETIEAVSEDISLTGMRLRMSRKPYHQGSVTALVFSPNKSLENYSTQKPVAIHANVCWESDKEGDHYLGIDYSTLNPQQQQTIEDCFAFFEKSPYYENEQTG